MSIKASSKSKHVFLVAEYDGRKATVRRTLIYKETIRHLKNTFKALRLIPDDDVEIHARIDEHADLIRITEDVWRELVPELSSVKVLVDTSNAGHPVRGLLTAPAHERVTIRRATGEETILKISLDILVSELLSIVGTIGIYKAGHFALIGPDCHRLSANKTLRQQGVNDGDEIYAVMEQIGGKPVIYLFPPTPTLDIRLELGLVESWSFSALYPAAPILTPVSTTHGQSVSWTVDAKPDGALFDRHTQREISYLFWEAHTQPSAPISPAGSRACTPTIPGNAKTFDPARYQISSSDAVLLPFDKITSYIDDALLSLGLHTEARTSFITYWLPSLQRHSFIALCFLPQSQYEAAAPMKIEPAPDVVSRVFMVFKGVEKSQLGAWSEAHTRASMNPSMWTDIVGIKLDMAKDEKLFRVLEWGGMEIK
ncbi:polyubiquitin-C [Ceratobasidium sp. AG-Ba]|nr:polyubiquitin-C [Ceratobasidium sp. AG-Ba]